MKKEKGKKKPCSDWKTEEGLIFCLCGDFLGGEVPPKIGFTGDVEVIGPRHRLGGVPKVNSGLRWVWGGGEDKPSFIESKGRFETVQDMI